jgi:rhodanese-related sulfurtransferase
MTADTISIAELKRVVDSGAPLTLIDVRTPAEFDAVHAVGARSVPLDTFDPTAIATARGRADAPIYLICQSGGRSAKACEMLRAAGVGPALSVDGGTAAWQRAGLPVVRSARPVMSLERQVRIGAGSLVVIGTLLAATVHRYLLVIPAFVGAGPIFAGLSNFCGLGLRSWRECPGTARPPVMPPPDPRRATLRPPAFPTDQIARSLQSRPCPIGQGHRRPPTHRPARRWCRGRVGAGARRACRSTGSSPRPPSRAAA